MNMNQENKNSDYLAGLFSRLPKTELPGTFRSDLMRKIQLEAARERRRGERLGLAATILASIGLIALAIGTLAYLDVSGLSLPAIPDKPALAFYLYIGGLALLLLLADHLLRRTFRREKGQPRRNPRQ